MFTPYNATKEPYHEAREAAATIAEHVVDAMNPQPTSRPSFLFFNNRLEGNALFTLIGVIALLKQRGLLEKLGLKG